MTTYKGLPGPQLCDFWDREASASNYDDGSTFQIGRIDMVANTGTYLDSPFHRYADGADLAELPLPSLADLPGIVVRRPWENDLAVDVPAFDGRDVAGKAVLVHTGWDTLWRTPAYLDFDNSHLTEDAAAHLVERGAALVGIDSVNIDSLADKRRPVHTLLLGRQIPIVEHLCNLASITTDVRFFAAPVAARGIGTFPTRAYAIEL